jgi:hypothetical protein
MRNSLILVVMQRGHLTLEEKYVKFQWLYADKCRILQVS